MTAIHEYPTPLAGNPLITLADGTTVQVTNELDIRALFPSTIPNAEQIVYDRVREAANSRLIFPRDGLGVTLPATFNVMPDLSLYADRDGSYVVNGEPVEPIPVIRGWPEFPGQVPAIGVSESTSDDDPGEESIFGGFAGDVSAVDSAGNVVATAAYYAEPLQTVVVVELIHTNRGERDRLHDQLRRVLWPLRHLLPSQSPQTRDVRVSGEKQDLPQDELPRPVFVSVFTVTVVSEALIPAEITPGGTITAVDTIPGFATDPSFATTVTPTP